MSSLKEILESAGLPAQRGVYTGRCKPKAYYTFLRLNGGAAVSADDTESESREMYRVTLFHKGSRRLHQQRGYGKLRNRNGVLVSAYHNRNFKGVTKQ